MSPWLGGLTIVVVLGWALHAFPILRVRPARLRSGRQVDVVVSAYREDLGWLDHLLTGMRAVEPPRLIVYSKHSDTAVAKGRASLVLPNVGRCDHTYLHHIVENYDQLADTTLFVTGSARTLWWKWLPLRYLMLSRLGANEAVLAGGARPFTRLDRNLRLQSYRARSDRERQQRPLVPAKPRPFSAWWALTFPDRPEPRVVAVGGVFAAQRSAIRAVPLSIWEDLLDQHAVGDNVEVGHYMERSWYALLASPAPGDASKE